MTEIQEKIEQFQYHYSRYYSPKGRLEFVDEFRDIIRSFVKECCALSDEWEDIIKHEGIIQTPGDYIRSHFPWLFKQ